SNVFSGYLVDKTGMKKVLSIGFLVNGLVFFSNSLLQTPLQMFVVRLINGFTSGILPPAAFTYLTLYSKSKKSGKTMAFAAAVLVLPQFPHQRSADYKIKPRYSVISLASIVRSSFCLTYSSAHNPCRNTALVTEYFISFSVATKASNIPVKVSPEPPFARAAFPELFTYPVPTGKAITVYIPFKTTIT